MNDHISKKAELKGELDAFNDSMKGLLDSRKATDVSRQAWEEVYAPAGIHNLAMFMCDDVNGYYRSEEGFTGEVKTSGLITAYSIFVALDDPMFPEVETWGEISEPLAEHKDFEFVGINVQKRGFNITFKKHDILKVEMKVEIIGDPQTEDAEMNIEIDSNMGKRSNKYKGSVGKWKGWPAWVKEVIGELADKAYEEFSENKRKVVEKVAREIWG